MTDTTTALPALAPDINPETKPFWDATLEGRLLIKKCTACGDHYWYPRTICPLCGSFDTEWVEAAGTGTIYTFSVQRKGAGPWAAAGPYVLAYIQLDEGPRVLTNIVNAEPESLHIGDPVKVTFQPTETEAALFRFEPA